MVCDSMQNVANKFRGSSETKGKRDNLSEKEIDAIYNLTRLWAIFLADNLWAEAEAIVKIRMSDDAVREWILLRGGRFDADGVFVVWV